MAERTCPHCAMGIPKEAKICPFCRKKLGWTIGAKLGVALLILIAISYVIGTTQSPSTSEKSATYTDAQKKTAKEVQDLFMKSGLIKELKGEGKLQIIYVDRGLWNATTYENKKDFLKNYSKTNEILGFTPWVEIRDQLSGEVYGALKPPLTFEIYK